MITDQVKYSQWMYILDHIEQHGSITAKDAHSFGCERLAARVADLRKRGYPIITQIETAINHDGHVVRYARYSLGVMD